MVFVTKKGNLIFRRHSTVPELYDWLITSNSQTSIYIFMTMRDCHWWLQLQCSFTIVHVHAYMNVWIYIHVCWCLCLLFFNHTTLSFLCLNVFIVHYKYILYIFPLGPKSHQLFIKIELNCTLKIKNVLVNLYLKLLPFLVLHGIDIIKTEYAQWKAQTSHLKI